MGELIGSYDPKDVRLTFGNLIITGFAPGTFITAKRADNEIWKSEAGAGGEVGRTKNNNTIGTITFSLKQTSPSRIDLDNLKNSPAAIPVSVINQSDRRHVAGGTEAWIKTEPDVEYGDEESAIEDVIEVATLQMAATG